ncbi:cysteine hydrolase family protein [Streptomyces sp. NPDC096311]|uniref:cysteine hydrolase family protein n=1 Tax=Streptomyces sp. NPDC096311 TaxID=3366083 RepID=UPI0037F5E0D0
MPSTLGVPDRAALLILHLQPPLTDIPGADKMVARVAQAVSAARKSGVEVMYVSIGYRPGYPEIGSDDPARPGLLSRGTLIAGVNNDVHASLAPQEDDVQFTNPRCNAFSGSDLESILRLKDINHLVLSGIATSGAVLGTLTDANDRNYRITVLSDGVMDFEQDIHDAMLKVFVKPPRRARLVTIEDWITEITEFAGHSV